MDVRLAEISQPPPKPTFTSIAFSNNGNYILVGTASNVHYVLDAFKLSILRRLVGHTGLGRDRGGVNGGASGEEISWSSDSRWIVSGSADGNIYLWEIAPSPGQTKIEPPNIPDNALYTHPAPTLQPTITLTGSRAASRAVKFNPRFVLLAVGGEELVSEELVLQTFVLIA